MINKSIISLSILFSMSATSTLAGNLDKITACMSFCKTGNPECFDLGPAFEPAPFPLAQIAITAALPEGGRQPLCENRDVFSIGETVHSEGATCLVKSRSGPSSLTIPEVLHGKVGSEGDLNHFVLFGSDQAPIWLGGVPGHPYMDGKVKFIARSDRLVIFGLQGENAQACLGFFAP